jgi:uncharacterized lipoprotein YmbA
MTPRFPAWIAAAAAALFIAAGCASSPPSRFYTLNGATPPARAPSNLAVAIGPVAIPAVVDRPQIVVTIGDNEVRLDEFNRWAAPLSDAIGLVVAENLAAALGSSQVTLSSQATGSEPDFRATIEVQRFESRPGIHALLDAVYGVRRVRDGAAVSGRTTVTEAVPTGGYDALAAAHSRALARLGRDLAEAIRKVANAPPALAAAMDTMQAPTAASSPAR